MPGCEHGLRTFIYALHGVLAGFAIIITLGGMKVIGYADVIQVFFLVLGGLATTHLALDLVSQHFQTTGTMNGLNFLMSEANDHFHMIFDESNLNYVSLPGLTVLIGAMWVVNLNYWGCKPIYYTACPRRRPQDGSFRVVVRSLPQIAHAGDCCIAWYCRLCLI